MKPRRPRLHAEPIDIAGRVISGATSRSAKTARRQLAADERRLYVAAAAFSSRFGQISVSTMTKREASRDRVCVDTNGNRKESKRPRRISDASPRQPLATQRRGDRKIRRLGWRRFKSAISGRAVSTSPTETA